MSRFFTRQELLASYVAQERGISNALPERLTLNFEVLLAGLERTRAYLGKPMIISSGYRCPELNRLVGGSDRSQHMVAQAADFTCPQFGDPQDVARALLKARFILGIDQLILEASWVHVSFTLSPRHQSLRCVGRGKYVPLEG